MRDFRFSAMRPYQRVGLADLRPGDRIAVDFETVQPFKALATQIRMNGDRYTDEVWADLTVRVYDTPERLRTLGELAMANPLNLSFTPYPPQAAYGTTVPTTKPESAVAKRARKLAEAADGVRFAEQRATLKALGATPAQYEDSSAFLTVVSDTCNKLRNAGVDKIREVLCSPANDPTAIARAVPPELRIGSLAAALTSRDRAVGERDKALRAEQEKTIDNGRLRHTVDASRIRIEQLESANRALSDCIASDRKSAASQIQELERVRLEVCRQRDNVNGRNAILIKERNDAWEVAERAKRELKIQMDASLSAISDRSRDAARRDAKEFQKLAEIRNTDLVSVCAERTRFQKDNEALAASNKELARKVLAYEQAPIIGQFVGTTPSGVLVVKTSWSGSIPYRGGLGQW